MHSKWKIWYAKPNWNVFRVKLEKISLQFSRSLFLHSNFFMTTANSILCVNMVNNSKYYECVCIERNKCERLCLLIGSFIYVLKKVYLYIYLLLRLLCAAPSVAWLGVAFIMLSRSFDDYIRWVFVCSYIFVVASSHSLHPIPLGTCVCLACRVLVMNLLKLYYKMHHTLEINGNKHNKSSDLLLCVFFFWGLNNSYNTK